MEIKICGITKPREIEILNELKPRYAGFVFAQSRRKVETAEAAALIAALSPEILPVGVFVNAPPAEALEAARRCGLYAVQLHGDEDEAYTEKIRAAAPDLKIIRAARTKDLRALRAAIAAKPDFILFDAYKEGERGGSGQSADHGLIERIKSELTVPYFVAGGITPENLAQTALLHSSAHALDVSSGAESAEGKDRSKIVRLISALP
ncbi:MAG: phosphoribosylanthranilate isomerase [Clostridiales bacterium]|jgi:phosphoribosylanthranilate isomerase|nr:phosphoribosylanthranilate isomerase [Clostridiales bacterium]